MRAISYCMERQSAMERRFSITTLDVAVYVIVTGAIVFFVHRVTTGLNYHWNWSVIPQYLVRYDEQTGRWTMNLLMQGFITTVKLSLWTIVLATILGTVMGLLRTSHRPVVRLAVRTYVELTRNIPPLVLIFIFYFFIGEQIMSLIGIERLIGRTPPWFQGLVSTLFTGKENLSAFLSALITLVIYEGSYITEIIRAGIESIEKGQWEASAASGLTRIQQVRHVIMPQAVRRVIPPIAGQFISTIKDSAIVSVISIQELTFQGMELMSATYLTFEVWITITLMYFVLTALCSFAMQRLEGRLRDKVCATPLHL